MEFNEVLKQRREITSFLNRSISADKMERILDDAWLAPTGNNLPSREFIVVQKRASLDYLANATPYVSWLKEAQLAIVITGRPDVSKYWIQDASISSGYIWLSAVNEGLGCAFGAILNTSDEEESIERETYVKDGLQLPSDRRVVAILGIGYAKQQPQKKNIIDKNELIHYEKFGEKVPLK